MGWAITSVWRLTRGESSSLIPELVRDFRRTRSTSGGVSALIAFAALIASALGSGRTRGASTAPSTPVTRGGGPGPFSKSHARERNGTAAAASRPKGGPSWPALGGLVGPVTGHGTREL